MDILLWILIGFVLFHHIFYPLILKFWANKKISRQNKEAFEISTIKQFPSIAIIIPAYQEEKYIADKIRDCLALDYPKEKLEIIVASDGCTDKTVEIAKGLAKSANENGFNIQVNDFKFNRGKVAVLNEVIAKNKSDIVVLSDVSANVTKDALMRLAAHFQSEEIGVVCGTYQLAAETNAGEKTYWDYQTLIKQREAAIASPMGAHGAFYAFRKALWLPLAYDTINDDFILPMMIVKNGKRAIYDTSIIAYELEPTSLKQDYRRRIRIAAGNMQQSLRLIGMASFDNIALSFVFLGGKFSRAFMPFVLLLIFYLTLILSLNSEFYSLIFAAQAIVYTIVGFDVYFHFNLKPLKLLSYLVKGHFAGFVGALSYLIGFERSSWSASRNPQLEDGAYIAPRVVFFKRVIDILSGLVIFVIYAVLLIPIAILIKLDSKGPILYRQLRVGISTERETKLFYLTKFRSMRTDAEKAGAVWASKKDPRITRIGNFLRVTRLDELPQCMNVIRGEMSLVGPRPERPSFFAQLEEDIPFFSERVSYLKPGITGLAQVEAGYPTTIEETRFKVMLDHAYAMRISTPMSWLKTDLEIMLKTIAVMVKKQGT